MNITLFPGDYLIDSTGAHVCDENGFAIKTTEKKEVALPNCPYEKYNDIVFRIINDRETDNVRLGSVEETAWLLALKGMNYKKGQLIKLTNLKIQDDNDTKIYSVKNAFCLCDETCGQLLEDLSYDVPLKNKRRLKVKTVEEKKQIMKKIIVSVPEPMIVFDEEKNAYIQKTVDKTIEVEQPDYDEFPLYNEDDVQVGSHKVIKEETVITEEVEKDEYGQDIYEDVLDEQDHPLMEPALPVKFFIDNNNSLIEIESNTFDDSNLTHLKLIKVNISRSD